jgi:recombination protein RecT
MFTRNERGIQMGEEIRPHESSAQQHPRVMLADMIQKNASAILKSLPRHLTPERMLRVCQTAVSKTPALWDCAPDTIVSSMVEASQLGLEPNGPLGLAALVPFKNKKTRRLECQLMVMYRGYVELADRTDRVDFIDAQIVYDCDVFEFEYGTDQRLRHVPSLNRPKDAKPIAGYGLVKYKNGAVKFTILSTDEIEEIRDCSRAKTGDAWSNWWGEMAKKTCIRRLVKYVSLSPELNRAAYLDESMDGGVRPEDAANQSPVYTSDAANVLRERLDEATARDPIDIDADFGVEPDTPPEPPDPPAYFEPITPDSPPEPMPPEPVTPDDPLDASRLQGSKFGEKLDKLMAEFLDLATNGQGLSSDEAAVKWKSKLFKVIGAEGCADLVELNQKGKNSVIKAMSAAVADYRAALDAREA